MFIKGLLFPGKAKVSAGEMIMKLLEIREDYLDVKVRIEEIVRLWKTDHKNVSQQELVFILDQIIKSLKDDEQA